MRVLGGESVAAAMERTNNRSSGFDYLRIGLAAAVVLWHSFRTSYFGLNMDGWYRPVVGLVLPMFFALSGFLVSGSLLRVRSIHEFAILRAVRIVPALAVETTLSMILIGAAFTSLPLAAYYTHPETLAYLKNIYGDIHFLLPGVFKDNPRTAANASLWTIPFELECYFSLIVLWITRIIKLPSALLAFVVFAQVVVPIFDFLHHVKLSSESAVPGRVLLLAFLFGVAIYFFRERVRLTLPLFIVAVAVAVVLLLRPASSYFVGLPAAYVTVFLGLKNPPKIGLIFKGDYSYGLYLYSYPIQQAIAAAFPQYRHWYISFAATLVLAGLCAAFSWHLIEKPVLRIRMPLVGAIDRMIDGVLRRRPRKDPPGNASMDEKAAVDRR